MNIYKFTNEYEFTYEELLEFITWCVVFDVTQSYDGTYHYVTYDKDHNNIVECGGSAKECVEFLINRWLKEE